MTSSTTWSQHVAFCTKDACGVEFEAWDINDSEAYLDKVDPKRHERAAAEATAALEALRHNSGDEVIVPFREWPQWQRDWVMDLLVSELDDWDAQDAKESLDQNPDPMDEIMRDLDGPITREQDLARSGTSESQVVDPANIVGIT